MSDTDIKDEKKRLLDDINYPQDLKRLSMAEKVILACEIRDEIVEVVSTNGGHLAPNMGVVELTIALHAVFDTPKDKFIWDVGHQGYVHKMLTGRREALKKLRRDNGCLGFLSRDESEYDVFGAGHAGTAISAALGIATARDMKGGDEHVVAIVGDGSLNCGISIEGLNNVAECTKKLIIILNDNKMSIAPNVGAMARYLNKLISARPYNAFKAFVRKLVRSIPRVGDDITRKIAKLEEAAKSVFVPGVFFEELGFRYLGPVDGHDIGAMMNTFDVVREFDKPVLVHVITEKGRGYHPAEAAPEKFHGLSPFNPDTGESKLQSGTPSFSAVFGDAILELADKRKDVAAITAGMRSGTGLMRFAEKFPDRFFDVGIAEEHAVVFAAGLSVEGVLPVVAIYATFLQRALDCVFHDICLQNLPVIICADRAGIVDDGPTHHGILDVAFLLELPNLSILSPRDGRALRDMLTAASEHRSPVVIRYPKAAADDIEGDSKRTADWGRSEILKEGTDIVIWALGRECSTALEVSEILEKRGISAGVVDTRFLKPFDSETLLKQAKAAVIATIEDGHTGGGLGGVVDSILVNERHKKIIHFGWNDDMPPHGTVEGIRESRGMSASAIADALFDSFHKKS